VRSVSGRCCGIPTYERKGNRGDKQPSRKDVSHGGSIRREDNLNTAEVASLRSVGDSVFAKREMSRDPATVRSVSLRIHLVEGHEATTLWGAWFLRQVAQHEGALQRHPMKLIRVLCGVVLLSSAVSVSGFAQEIGYIDLTHGPFHESSRHPRKFTGSWSGGSDSGEPQAIVTLLSLDRTILPVGERITFELRIPDSQHWGQREFADFGWVDAEVSGYFREDEDSYSPEQGGTLSGVCVPMQSKSANELAVTLDRR